MQASNSDRVTLVAHQRWKLFLALALLLLSGALMWLDKQFAGLLSVSRYVPTLIGTLLGLASLVFAVVAIRCPGCRVSLVWWAMSRESSYTWLPWLLKETKCPKCGYVVAEPSSADGQIAQGSDD